LIMTENTILTLIKEAYFQEI